MSELGVGQKYKEIKLWLRQKKGHGNTVNAMRSLPVAQAANNLRSFTLRRSDSDISTF